MCPFASCLKLILPTRFARDNGDKTNRGNTTVENKKEEKPKTVSMSLDEMINELNKEETNNGAKESAHQPAKVSSEAKSNLEQSRNNFFRFLDENVNDTDTVPPKKSTPPTTKEHQEP